MRIENFDIYKDLLYEKSGLTITPDKSYLLDSRLGPVAKKWNFDSLEAMSISLQGVPSPDLVKDVVEAMTTNETLFFRDTRPFDTFRDVVLPHMLKERAALKKIRIWCAACSSGQEPYSLAMLLEEQVSRMSGWTVEIVATDISTDILAQAQRAEFSQFEVQRGLPIQMLMKYFEQDGDKWKLKPVIKNKITFKYFNLLDSMTLLGRFDVVFCRNVLIYFDKETKGKVLDNIAVQMPEDGFLFLGGAETVLGITGSFKPIDGLRGVYERQSGTASAAITQAAAL